MTLSDRIDHLTATAKAIRASAAAIVPSDDNPDPIAIPFTRAVLETALGDLIRDIDASELGLFTLVPAPDAEVRKHTDDGTLRGQISRVEFPGATPLRKQPTRRDDAFRPKEYEPEVYAHAALKYLDRYQSIRRMPRARTQAIAIIEQVGETRENIKRLNETLQELTSAGATSDPTSSVNGVAEEERRITDLQNRLVELRNQKDVILRSNESRPAPTPRAAPKSIPEQSLPLSPEPENQEDAFWSTPGTASGRALQFTDKLLEEKPDFAALSSTAFDSPGPAPPRSMLARFTTGNSPTKKGLDLPEDSMLGEPHLQEREGDGTGVDLYDASSPLPTQINSPFAPEMSVPGDLDEEEEGDVDEDRTVILSKAPLAVSENTTMAKSEPQTNPSVVSQLPPDSSSKVRKVCVTPELKSIVARIWSTVGDILLPGKGSEKPSRVEETLDLIESMATRSPSPGSPASSMSSITSASSGPTHHQVNTAQLLHALLTAPNHAMPLNQLKAVIGGTRALYACVAKKLIRIDRSGGEQLVLFDA